MKRMLIGFTVVVMALAVQAQMGDKMGGGVEKAIAGLEKQWADAGKMSNADGVAPLSSRQLHQSVSDGTVANKTQRWLCPKGSE